MTREKDPREAQRRYFSPLEAQMISWMVLEYDENSPANPYKQLAIELGIDFQDVNDAAIRLEEITHLERPQAMALVVKTAVLNGEIGAEKILETPMPFLEKNEQLLKKECCIWPCWLFRLAPDLWPLPIFL